MLLDERESSASPQSATIPECVRPSISGSGGLRPGAKRGSPITLLTVSPYSHLTAILGAGVYASRTWQPGQCNGYARVGHLDVSAQVATVTRSA